MAKRRKLILMTNSPSTRASSAKSRARWPRTTSPQSPSPTLNRRRSRTTSSRNLRQRTLKHCSLAWTSTRAAKLRSKKFASTGATTSLSRQRRSRTMSSLRSPNPLGRAPPSASRHSATPRNCPPPRGNVEKRPADPAPAAEPLAEAIEPEAIEPGIERSLEEAINKREREEAEAALRAPTPLSGGAAEDDFMPGFNPKLFYKTPREAKRERLPSV